MFSKRNIQYIFKEHDHSYNVVLYTYNGRTTDLTIKIVTTKISKKKQKSPIEKIFL